MDRRRFDNVVVVRITAGPTKFRNCGRCGGGCGCGCGCGCCEYRRGTVVTTDRQGMVVILVVMVSEKVQTSNKVQ